MNLQHFERQFHRIGARAKVHPPLTRRWAQTQGVSIDIGHDAKGEFFDLSITPSLVVETEVIDVQPTMRHLLLMSRQDNAKSKFLCGHDERHWFVAAVPEQAGVSTVKEAFHALKPREVRVLEARLGVSTTKRYRRRNAAFVRQGEWFFVPVENAAWLDKLAFLRNEPISRGRGKPHLCEELIRHGGELVYVSHRYPGGLTEAERSQLFRSLPESRHYAWTARQRDPSVYVRGRVRHSDHKTIVLGGWHRVLMNTENQSIAMRNVAFID